MMLSNWLKPSGFLDLNKINSVRVNPFNAKEKHELLYPTSKQEASPAKDYIQNPLT